MSSKAVRCGPCAYVLRLLLRRAAQSLTRSWTHVECRRNSVRDHDDLNVTDPPCILFLTVTILPKSHYLHLVVPGARMHAYGRADATKWVVQSGITFMNHQSFWTDRVIFGFQKYGAKSFLGTVHSNAMRQRWCVPVWHSSGGDGAAPGEK